MNEGVLTASGPCGVIAQMPFIKKHSGEKLTYIGESKRSQSCPRLSEKLVLTDTFCTKSLNSSVDDLKGH